MSKSKYYAARPFNDGNRAYGAGSPVPLRQRGEGPECGIRESQVNNLLRTGLISEQEIAEETEQKSPLPLLAPVQKEAPAAKPAKKKPADEK